MSNERARNLIDKGDLGTLYENDQLNLQMVHGQSFQHYSEMTPNFFPTYKFNLGTDDYDTSEKARIPAWTDRIVTKADNLRQLYYDSAPLRFSDHRPVWGLFRCTISVTDQNKKDQISSELYEKRRAFVGEHTANYKGDDSDIESLVGYESVEPGLPPASSDKRKWWLDNGMPATSTVKPANGQRAPNGRRPSNPWSPTLEPDWVKIEKQDAGPSSRPSSVYSNLSLTSQGRSEIAKSDVPPRKLPPPLRSLDSTPERPPRPATFGMDGASDDVGRVHLKQTLRKPAPPPKPKLLRGESGQSVASSVKSVAPPPPDPRRTNGDGPPPPSRAQTSGMQEGRTQSPAPQPPPPRKKPVPTPPLPPRRATGLMDEAGDDVLQGWEPLKPR
jgi:hypothetical protein